MIDVTDVSVRSSGIELLPATSLQAGAGQAVAIRGRNGSGKSTLLRVLNGSYVPTTGTVAVAGRDPRVRDARSRRRTASMIGLPPMALDLTVRDHVELVATTWYDSADEIHDKVEVVLGLLDLTSLEARFPHELSSGQTQLFGLSLVLARPFDVLLLDEPEQRLDPERLDLVVAALRDARDAGATVVVATHSEALSNQLADSVVWLGAPG
ncbi:ABC transporter ATP-binding protein [Microbacterium rhizomatis]|uniref:ATP-binding cassette domain-containing protein n=1 Tax=Microbacterium rhizomatis TaxID=1631477 RepID=A0A5J5IVQ8_9MICO|nr:ATP-binding cassette domain-containing protein [Microbacterium rhizomatis]KAA9104506.1 ATP-binding cassette domain-containing protein [Microbacterium rhizomatis]